MEGVDLVEVGVAKIGFKIGVKEDCEDVSQIEVCK